MSVPVIEPETPPLRVDDTGAIRVGASRVLLELVVHAFEDGATPEAIVQRYPTVTLPEVYAAISYYLRHREQVGRYLATREKIAREVRDKINSSQGDLSDVRSRLLARSPR